MGMELNLHSSSLMGGKLGPILFGHGGGDGSRRASEVCVALGSDSSPEQIVDCPAPGR